MNSTLDAIGNDFGAWGVAFAVGLALNKLAHEFLDSDASLAIIPEDYPSRANYPLAMMVLGIVGFLFLYIAYGA